MEKSGSKNPTGDVKASLGASAARGAVWIYGRVLAVQLINLCAIAVLARQLDVRAFGIVALANVALMLLNVLASQGVNQYVIFDRAEGFELRARAAFWLNILIGTLAVGLGFLLAPSVATFFDEPQLVPILQLLLLRYPLNAVTNMFDAVRNKEMQFAAIELRDTIVALTIAAGSIGMALAGYGVWSIVVPSVAMAPVQAIVAIFTTSWRPGWRPHVRMWPGIIRYAIHIVGSTLTSFVVTHGDTVLLGKVAGAGALGFYNMAWRTSNLVSKSIVSVGSKLFFPMLAAVSTDRERMVEVLRKLLRVLSGITFPALIGLFVVADDFVYLLYGEKWSAVVLPLRILIIYAIRYSVGSPMGPTLKALGRPDLIFKLGLVTIPFYSAAILVGVEYGVVGVAVGVTVVRTIFGGASFVLVARQLGVSTRQIVAPMGPALLAASLMGIVVFLAKILFLAGAIDYGVTRLLVLVGLGVLAYALLVRLFFRELASEFGEVITRLSGRSSTVFHRILSV